MNRVLVDTGPLVALCDSADALHPRARKEFDRLKGTLTVGLPVLSEAFFLLPLPHLRARVVALIERDVLRLEDPEALEEVASRTFKWLERYAEHRPDFADGWLVEWAHSAPATVWTFDREFSTIWRSLKGKRVKLVP